MSSFRKRNLKKIIPFTRTSPQTGQMITSSGSTSLDTLLGGGLPIGSICLIEEDKYAIHSRVLAKYFLAEGIVSEQAVFLGSLDEHPLEVITRLPRPLNKKEAQEENIHEEKFLETNPQSELRIAWRYNDLPMVNTEKSSNEGGHRYNLSEQMDLQLLEYSNVVTWPDDPIVEENDDNEEDIGYHFNYDGESTFVKEDASKSTEVKNAHTSSNSLNAPPPANTADDKNATGSTETSSSLPTPPPPICKPPTETQLFTNPKYLHLLKEIQQMMRDHRLYSGEFMVQKTLCRICITSLGSPMWYDDNYGEDLLKFLTILRAVRPPTSVCFITMPMHLVAKYDESLVSKIRNLVDYAIELETLTKEQRKHHAFREHQGLIHLHKITAINTLSAYMPETTDLSFRVRRNNFVIEKIHLPPALQEDNNVTNAQPTLSCGSNTIPNAKLDF